VKIFIFILGILSADDRTCYYSVHYNHRRLKLNAN